MGFAKAAACTIGVGALLYIADEASAQDMGSLFPEQSENIETGVSAGNGDTQRASRWGGWFGVTEELEEGADYYGTLGGRVHYDLDSGLRLHAQAVGGVGFAEGQRSDLDTALLTAGAGLGYLNEECDPLSFYTGASILYDMVDLSDSAGVELFGNNLQFDLQAEGAIELVSGKKTSLALQLSLPLSIGYDGDVVGTEVDGSYEHWNFRARLQQEFELGLPMALRFEIRHESTNFENLIESYVNNFRIGLPIQAHENLVIEPYTGLRFEHLWYPRTSQGSAEHNNYYGGITATWYPIKSLGLQIDLRYDEEHQFNPTLGIVVRPWGRD